MNEINRAKRRFEILNDVPLGICVLKSDYTVLFWNKTLESIALISSDIITGQSILKFFPNFDKYSYNILLNDIFKGGPPLMLSSQLHKSMFLPKESIKKAHNVMIKAIPSENHGEYYALFNVDDVSSLTHKISEYKTMRDKAIEEIEQRKIVEKKLRESQSKLKELNVTKDKFFSIMAHDLINPIASFKDVSELLSSMFEDLSKEELKSFINELSLASEHLFKLLENLLLWSRSQTGRIEMHIDNIDISFLANSNTSLMNLNADNKNIQIVNNITGGFVASGDHNMINTVIRNLISNALKFTNSGGTITLDAELAGDLIKVSVADTGVGMSDEIRNKLFRIDTQVTSLGTEKEKGTGLGLILCKEFVEMHKGQIWVESEEGKGSTFYFTLEKADTEQADLITM